MSEHGYSYVDPPSGLTEQETLDRLTVDEKKQLARPAILEFPHLSHEMLNEWCQDYSVDVSVGASYQEKTDALLDALAERVESGDDPEALDNYLYGQVSEGAIADTIEADPEEVAGRDPDEVEP